jgi:hypothetical protein
MLNPRHFIRMARWARKPPSERRVKFVFAIIALCLIIAGVEALFGWPEALTVNSLR